MNGLIAFFMWLFGWTGQGVPVPGQGQSLTPATREVRMSTDGYEPERYRSRHNQQVTIIIYDDTHFGAKR